MGKTRVKGIHLEIGGDTTGLTKALSDVNKKARDVQGELREVDKSLKLDPTNTEVLRQKQKLLADSVENTRDKLEALKKAKADVDKRMANGDTQVSAEQYRKLEREISDTTAQLKKLEKESDQAGEALEKVGKAKESIGNLKKGFDIAAKGAAGFVAGAVAAGAAVFALEEETREYREDLNKLKVAFTSAEKDVKSAKKAYSDFYGILGESDRAIEAVNHLAELTKNEKELSKWTTIAAGVNAKFTDSLPIEGLTEASNETAKVGKVTGVLADALNWVSEDSNVFKEALGGNENALNAFNKALKDGEIVEDAFTAALSKMSTEEERASAITNTLDGIYSNIGETYLETNADIVANREAQLKWNDAMTKAAEKVAPIKAEVVSFGASLLSGAVDLVTFTQEVNENEKAIERCSLKYEESIRAIDEKTVAQLAELEVAERLLEELDLLVDAEGNVDEKNRARAEYIMGELNEALGTELEMNGKLRDSLDKIKGSIEDVILQRQASILMASQEEKVAEAYEIQSEALATQKQAYKDYLDAYDKYLQSLNGTPGQIASAYKEQERLWEAYQTATETVKNCSEEVSKYEEAITASLEGNVQGVISALNKENNAFVEAKDLAAKTEEEKKQILADQYYQRLLDAQVAATNYNAVQTEANKKALEEAVTHAANARKEYEAVGGAIVDGTVTGINGKKINIKSTIDSLFSMIPDWAKKILKINSPSKVMEEDVGLRVPEGTAKGIRGGINIVKKAVEEEVDAIKEGFTKKDALDINSPSGWSEEIAAFVDDGLAVGFIKNAGTVRKSLRELFGMLEDERKAFTEDITIEEKRYNEELKRIREKNTGDITAEEKQYNEELKRIREEGTEEQNEDYLEGLKNQAAAAKESNKLMREQDETYLEGLKNLAEAAKERRNFIREQYEAALDDIKNVISELEKEMESYKNGLSETNLLGEDKYIFDFDGKEKEYTVPVLADLSPKVAKLESFIKNINSLKEMGIDETMIEQIQKLGGEEGGKLAQALLNSTSEEREKFIDDFKKIGKLSGEATAEMFQKELTGVADDLKAKMDELAPDLLQTGEDWGSYLGRGIMNKLREALNSIGIMADYELPAGGGTVVTYNTNIENNIQATPDTANELSNSFRRDIENLRNWGQIS